MAPVQSGMLLFCNTFVKYGTQPVRDVEICSIMVKYGTRPVRDVKIMHYYGKIWLQSSQGCCYFAKLGSNKAPVQSGMLIICNIMLK